MLKKIVVLMYLLTLVNGSYAVTENTQTDSKKASPVTSMSETQTSITVNIENPQFVVKLKSNPTTGYQWFLREYDPNLITPLKHNYVAPNSKLMGAPGYEMWTFEVKQNAFTVPHLLTIRMVYARPWNEESGNQITFRISTLVSK